MSATATENTPSTRLFLAVAASAVFVSVLTATMINVLLPLIRTQFDASPAQVGWIVTGYSLAYAIGVPLYGRIWLTASRPALDRNALATAFPGCVVFPDSPDYETARRPAVARFYETHPQAVMKSSTSRSLSLRKPRRKENACS